MSTLAVTIDRALNNIGQTARGVLRETVNAFDILPMSDEERLSAIATALAATAIIHHGRHVAKFLDAVRIWSLEAEGERAAPVPYPECAQAEQVSEAAELISTGTAALLDALDRDGVRLEDRVVAELALYTQLLGRSDLHTVLQTFGAVADAVASPGFRAGYLVRVEVCAWTPVGRDADLAAVPTLGIA
ncbi:MAG TPA: hypothetical protein VKS60_01605 [Stellaceae bacterium]|nr:hypothetical protein [Stellaceae bacterium]